jgi:hypothetical protein
VGRSLPFLAAATLLLVGCGERSEPSAEAPAPADLAADALTALGEQGSAHFVVDATFRDPRVEDTAPLVLHAEGDASRQGLAAEGSVDYGLGPVEGKLLIGEDEVLVYARAFDEWYGTRGWGFGFAAAVRNLPHDEPVWLLGALPTEEGMRAYFDHVVDARVVPGPELDGVSTWQLQGGLDAEGLTQLVRGSQEDLHALEVVAPASQVTIVVGRDDHLPRSVGLRIDLSPEAGAEIDDWDAFELPGGGILDTRIHLELSRFGEPVAYDPPVDFRPLDELFERLFAGLD